MDYGSGVYGRGTVGISADVVLMPTMNTMSPTDMTKTTALLRGIVSRVGDSPVTMRGFYVVQGSEADPTPSDIVVDESGAFIAGVFSLPIDSLLPDTDYRVMAFAENNEGRSEGIAIPFRTGTDAIMATSPVTDIEASAATFWGGVVGAGRVLPILERGFYYMIGGSGDPTAANETISETGEFQEGGYSLRNSGLIDSSNYRVASFCRNAAGIFIGPTVSMSTPTFKNIIPGGAGDMIMTMKSLRPKTRYFVRGFAKNSVGVAYGVEAEFVTGPDGKPRVIFMDTGASLT